MRGIAAAAGLEPGPLHAMKEVTPRLTEHPAPGGSRWTMESSSWPHMGPPGPPQELHTGPPESSPQDLQPSPRELRALPQPPLNLQLGSTTWGTPLGAALALTPRPPVPQRHPRAPGPSAPRPAPAACRKPLPGAGRGGPQRGARPAEVGARGWRKGGTRGQRWRCHPGAARGRRRAPAAALPGAGPAPGGRAGGCGLGPAGLSRAGSGPSGLVAAVGGSP